MTWLDWTKCTSPGGSPSAAALLTTIQALASVITASTVEALTGDLTLKSDLGNVRLKAANSGGVWAQSDSLFPLLISSADGVTSVASIFPSAGPNSFMLPVTATPLDPILSQDSTATLTNKTLTDPILTNNLVKTNGGTASVTFPTFTSTVATIVKNVVTQNNAGHAALTAAQSGSLVKVTQDGAYSVTLPAVTTAGLNFTFILNGAAANTVNIVPASGTTFVGNVMQPTGNVVFQTAKGNIRFVSGTAVNGDKVYVESDGSVWSVQAYSGANGGIVLV